MTSNTDLNQADADGLIALEKYKIDSREWRYPYTGGRTNIPLISSDRREEFYLDLYRGGIALNKRSLQTRARRVTTLVRLCVGGPPHRNPDYTEIPCPHLHVYREGYADKWAIPAPSADFANCQDIWDTLQDFMRYCNIVDPPIVRRELLT